MPWPNIMHQFQNQISRSAYFFYHSRWMPGRKAINDTRSWALAERIRFNELPADVKSNQILQALQSQVAYCRRFVPYYREILKSAPEDFPRNFMEYRQFPILTKEIIRQAGDALISEEFTKKELKRHLTGGSTGEPVTVYMSPAEDGIGGYEYFMCQNNVGPGSRLATLYGGELDVSVRPSHIRQFKDWLLNMKNYGCFRLDEEYLLEVHSAFEHFQPDVLVGYASAVYLLARTLDSHKIRPSYPNKLIITAAEKLEQFQRDVVEGVFTPPVIERYGSRDAGTIGEQRPGDRRIWLDSWDYLVEPDAIPDNSHQAPVLISRLHTRAMPLMRYRIGDQAVFPATWNVEQPPQYLEEINGRVLDFIYLPQGRLVHGSEFPHLFKDFDVILYQVMQDVSSDVTVSILAGQGFDAEQKNRCECIITENLPGVDVVFKYPQELERTVQKKLRPVISMYKPD